MAKQMTSDWQDRANKRRDERQTKVPDIRAPRSNNRDTKKWCRGKIGVEHKPIVVDYREYKNLVRETNPSIYKGWKLLICSECSKELDYYWPIGFGKIEKPDWVKNDGS